MKKCISKHHPLEKIENMPQSYSSSSQTSQPVQHNSPSAANIAGYTVSALLLLAVPVSVVLGIYFYKSYYRAYRAALRIRQIEYLERLWQISPKQ